jgi:hypothetical protein
MNIILIHPKATPDSAGYLPDFLNEADPRPAREQFNTNYKYGGWRPMQDFTLNRRTFALTYPGDPPILPLVALLFRKELITVYESDIVAIIQSDGTFEVARMD